LRSSETLRRARIEPNEWLTPSTRSRKGSTGSELGVGELADAVSIAGMPLAPIGTRID
jgi:hypothetical protein